MSNTVISIENLSKSYRLGEIGTGTFYGDLKQWWARRQGQPDPYRKVDEVDQGNRQGETIWALKDLNFSIQQGEAVGIIGANGAGKSTLLKVLSQVTAPTTGVVKLKGRIASLLEVGTGFHPELTGRENIYLNGAILGMSRAEVTRKFDEIVSFSGVGKFIDTPVKRYSSGMHVRLGFAVAAHLDSEILIVDEVLAVGDASFRRKSIGKMGEVTRTGRTVLFVSHNMTAIQNLCERVIWLNRGSVLEEGPAQEVVKNYLQTFVETSQTERNWTELSEAPGNEKVRIRRAFVRPCSGTPEHIAAMDEEIEIGFEFWSLVPGQEIGIALQLLTTDGVVVFATGTNNNPSLRKPIEEGLHDARCRIPANLLNNVQYRVQLFVIENQTKSIFKMDDVLSFEVMDAPSRRSAYLRKRAGIVAPLLDWSLEFKDATPIS